MALLAYKTRSQIRRQNGVMDNAPPDCFTLRGAVAGVRIPCILAFHSPVHDKIQTYVNPFAGVVVGFSKMARSRVYKAHCAGKYQ